MYNDDNNVSQLHTLVLTAERERDSKNTTALQEYIDNHPQLAQSTLRLTEEIQQKLCFYIGNGEQQTQHTLQEELDSLRKHLANLSEKPTILHHLLCEEVLVSFLMLRCADVMYSRHHANISSIALRKGDSAQIRFLRALKTLANMQKLPQFLNVNLGTQQIALAN